MPLVAHAAVSFGYQYRSRAVLGAPEDDAAPLLPDQLTGAPGTRAPHVVIERGGERVSTLDLYGRRFVLLTGPDGGAWATAAQTVAEDLGVPLGFHRIGADLVDVAGPFGDAYRLGPAGAVLVRPDGFVAWRHPGGTAEPEEALAHVLAAILAR